MSQGIWGGATSYEEQSLNDILDDINLWIDYTKKTKNFLETNKDTLVKEKYWNTIPFNFQATLLSTITQQKTFLEDFQLIIKAIKNDSITEREVKLLQKAGRNSLNFNREYGRTYNEECRWKDYNDPLFQIAEEMYQKGRDYFVTLQDASNAASRLNDYISHKPQISQTNITQNISGNGNQVSAINHGNMTQNTFNTNEKLIKDIESAISKIDEIIDIEPAHKEFIKNLLVDTSNSIQNNDEAKQSNCKNNLTSFLLGAGDKALKIINVLSSFAGIASFFGLTM